MIEALIPDNQVCFEDVCVEIDKITEEFKNSTSMDYIAYQMHNKMKKMIGF